MDPEPNLPPTAELPPAPKSRRRYIPGLWGWVGLVVVLLILAVLSLPLFNRTSHVGVQSKALGQAKSIGLALKQFAADSDGNYPRAGLPEMLGAEPKDANAAFAVLFPEYVTNETMFGNERSAYQTRPADNVYDNPYTGHPDKTLEPGENVYAYVAGLTDKSPPVAPLVADGTDGAGHYTTDPKKRGGVWQGNKAIIIRLDNSGIIETLTGPDDARYVPRADKGNLLDVSGLGPNARLLDPAVGQRAKP